MPGMAKHQARKHQAPKSVRGAKRNIATALQPAPSLLLSLGAAVLVTAVIFGSASVALRGDGGRQTTTNVGASRLQPVAPVAPSASPSPEPVASPSTTVRVVSPGVKAKPPTIEIRWTATSWVEVTIENNVEIFRGTFPKGTVKRFTGRFFEVEVGYGSAITLIYKGGKPRVAGAPGELVQYDFWGP